MYQTWREYEKEYSVFDGIEYSTKCAQIPTAIECILVTNNSMLHATMTTKVQDSILIDASHFNIQTNWNENHYSCYFFLDYWFSPYEFLLWFWLEALIPSQLNYLTDNLRSIYHMYKLGENGTGWSVYLKVFFGWRFQR